MSDRTTGYLCGRGQWIVLDCCCRSVEPLLIVTAAQAAIALAKACGRAS